MALTAKQKLRAYEVSWDLIDSAISTLTPVGVEEDITDVLGRAEALKSKIEEKASVLQEFDPN